MQKYMVEGDVKVKHQMQGWMFVIKMGSFSRRLAEQDSRFFIAMREGRHRAGTTTLRFLAKET